MLYTGMRGFLRIVRIWFRGSCKTSCVLQQGYIKRSQAGEINHFCSCNKSRRSFWGHVCERFLGRGRMVADWRALALQVYRTAVAHWRNSWNLVNVRKPPRPRHHGGMSSSHAKHDELSWWLIRKTSSQVCSPARPKISWSASLKKMCLGEGRFHSCL